MTHRTLDGMLKQYCHTNGDPYLHTYTQVLPISIVLLETLAQHGTKDAKWIRIALPAAVNSTARVIALPEGTEVVDVGINVNGNFMNMSMNPAMVLAEDECLRLMPMGTGHPDPDPQFVDGAPANVTWQFNPGVGSGRGVKGYWKWWRDSGLLQVDGLSPHTELLIHAIMPGFTPGVTTMIDSRMEAALQAYLRYQETRIDNSVTSNMTRAERENLQLLEQNYYAQLNLYVKLARKVPFHYILEAVRG